MFKGFLFMSIAVLAQLSRTDCFDFKITKRLENGEKLKKENWINVEISKIDSSENEGFTVTVTVPLSLPFSKASIFFANETKEILQICLDETVQGKYFTVPYQVKKTMNGEKVTVTKTNEFQRVSGSFPKSWMPTNSNKVSAAVIGVDGEIYNYYGLRNYGISIRDLLVLEEYLQGFPSA